MTSKNDSVEYKVMLKGFMWIGIILIIIILSLVVLALKPTVVVNNYISAGNYTFDVGPNMAKYMDKVTNQSIAQQEVTPSRKVDKVLAAYQQTLNNSNTPPELEAKYG